MGDTPVDFFVSYTSADRAWAKWIAWELEDAGFSVIHFVQAWDMQPGSSFVLQMECGACGGADGGCAVAGVRAVAVLSGGVGPEFDSWALG